MEKKVYQKPIGISPKDMLEIEIFQKQWAEMSGLVVKKTDVERVLILLAKTTPKEKIVSILKNSKEWYK